MLKSIDKGIFSGCVLNLPFMEGTGTATTADIAKGHHVIAMTHAPVWTQLASGKWALDFDGVNDYLTCGVVGDTDLNIKTGPLTLAAWVNRGGTGTIISRCDVSGGSSWQQWALYYNAFSICVSGHSAVSIALPDVPATGVWYHLVGTYDYVSAYRIYLNGVEVNRGSESGALRDAGKPVLVGAYYNAAAIQYLFDGLIAPPCIWNRCLAPWEAAYLFESERGKYGI